MAVTLTVYDLQHPEGELTESMFPGEDLELLATTWLAQAKTKVEAAEGITAANQNDAAASWAYHRAYTHIATRLNATAASASVDNVQRTIASDQRAYFARLASEKRGEYDLLNEDDAVDVTPRYSVNVRNQAVW